MLDEQPSQKESPRANHRPERLVRERFNGVYQRRSRISLISREASNRRIGVSRLTVSTVQFQPVRTAESGEAT